MGVHRVPPSGRHQRNSFFRQHQRIKENQFQENQVTNLQMEPGVLAAPPEPTQQDITTRKHKSLSPNTNYRSKVPGAVAISDDQIRQLAPSVFASQPIESVSERYSFLPTSSILKGMRENGWLPVRAEQQSVRTEAIRGFQKHLIRL